MNVWADRTALGTGGAAGIGRATCLPDRDKVSPGVILRGKDCTLEEFVPNREIVGDPEACIRELRRVRDLVDPEYGCDHAKK